MYTTQWLNEFHWSARGESAEDWLDSSKKSREKLPYPPVKVVFPTKATVQASTPGEKVFYELGLTKPTLTFVESRVAEQYFVDESNGAQRTFHVATSTTLRVKVVQS